MEYQRPLILISNDDGVVAKGIGELIKFLRPLGEIVVMAPDAPRSGSACALTVTEPIRYQLVRKDVGLTVYKCSGTPADCIKLAFHTVLDRKPDLVVGGINHGDNASVNTHYSGTMGVTLEGCMKYIPSVAFSLCDHSDDADFTPMSDIVKKITKQVLAEGLPTGVCLNVNFPLGDSYKGVRICRMARGTWGNEVVKCRHPRGYDYYWMTGEYTNDESEAEDTDNYALTHGYVAVTPTRIDVTAYEFFEQIKGWNIQ